MSALDGLLFVLLDCGSLDISILDDVGYDLGDIAVELQEEGVNVTLNRTGRTQRCSRGENFRTRG